MCTADVTLADTGPDDVVADRLNWVTELVASSGSLAEESLRPTFAPSFADRYPDGIASLITSWRGGGPYEVVSSTCVAHKGWSTLVGVDGQRHSLAVTVDTSGQIRRAIFEIEVLPRRPRSYEDVEEILCDTAVDSTAFVARRADEGWHELYARDAQVPMPGGSVFKVYVLLALANALEAGITTWDTELVLRPSHRSLPTGEMQDLPNGAHVTVREAAHNMFARSDNTAADLLITHLGRTSVVEAAVAAGHSHSDLMDPFPTSRELFEIGWGDSPHALEAWRTGNADARALLLDQLSGPLTARVTDLTKPVHHAGLDWFMSARDVAEGLHHLLAHARKDPDGGLLKMITAYPGVEIDRELWPTAVFKGGSTPGVVMFCWLLEDVEGVEHVVVLQQRAARVGLLRDGLHLRRLGAAIIHDLLP